jgi:hypothetical protein
VWAWALCGARTNDEQATTSAVRSNKMPALGLDTGTRTSVGVAPERAAS